MTKKKTKSPPIGSLARGASMKKLVAACGARVVTKQWATDAIWSPEPYYFERNQYSRGRKLSKQPARTKDATLYGYDANGDVARVRSWSGFLGEWHEEELFLPRQNGVVVGYRFRVDGDLLNVHRYNYDGEGRLVLHEVWFGEAKRSASQQFVYDDGRLVRVRVKNWGSDFALTWDDLGRLATIAEVWKGKRSVVYRRPPKGETLAELLAAVRERLRELVPRVAAKFKPKSTAYALLLVVDEEEWRHMLPPTLAMGFEEDRARFRAAHPHRVKDFLWSAPELPSYDVDALELRDRRLEAAATRANQHLWKDGKHAKVAPLLRGLARELQALDWRSLRSVSDDFIVYVTRAEGDGWQDVRRDAPADVRRRLVARGEL